MPTSEKDLIEGFKGATRGGVTGDLALEVSADYAQFLETNVIDPDNESMVAFLMVWALKKLPGQTIASGIPNNAVIVCSYAHTERATPGEATVAGTGGGTSRGTGQKVLEGGAWNGEGEPAHPLASGVQPAHFRQLKASATNGQGWLIDLVAAHQVKPLKSANIAGYFQSVGRTKVQGKVILDITDYAAQTLPRITASAPLRDMVQRSVWVDYHIAASSTPRLVQEMMNAYTDIAEVIFTEDDRDIVEDAVVHIYDLEPCRKIPLRLVAATHAYLVAHKKLPENWFQGERAKADVSGRLYMKYLVIFKRALVISSNTDQIENVHTLKDLAALLR